MVPRGSAIHPLCHALTPLYSHSAIQPPTLGQGLRHIPADPRGPFARLLDWAEMGSPGYLWGPCYTIARIVFHFHSLNKPLRIQDDGGKITICLHLRVFCKVVFCICVFVCIWRFLQHTIVVRYPGCSIETSCVFGLHQAGHLPVLPCVGSGHLVHPIYPMLETAMQCVAKYKKTSLCMLRASNASLNPLFVNCKQVQDLVQYSLCIVCCSMQERVHYAVH